MPRKAAVCELCKSSKALKLPKTHPHAKDGEPLKAWSATKQKFINICRKCIEYLDPHPEEQQQG